MLVAQSCQYAQVLCIVQSCANHNFVEINVVALYLPLHML